MSNIQHQEDQTRFVMEEDGYEAQVIYEMRGDVLHLTHTLVPGAIGGRGIAAKLVQAAMDYAKENNFKVSPDCSYAEAWIRKNPSYQDLVA